MYIEFKPGEKHAAKGADTADTPDNFKDAGWLLEKDEVIVDIDELSKEQIAEFVKRFDIHTQMVWTDRGAHFYFRKSPGYSRAKNGACALGFPIESKTSSNSPNGVTIKRNGVLREIENEGVREIVPWYFVSGKQYVSLLGIGEGEGRNNALFSHKQKLDNNPDTDKICRFVNEVLFDKPLEEAEYNNIVRSYTGNNGAETEYDHATNLINEYRCVVYQGSIWWWNGIEYVTDADDNHRLYQMITLRAPGKKTRYWDEIIKQIEKRGTHKDGCEFPIRFRNGFLDEGEFVEFPGFQEFTPYFIDVDYDPNAPAVPEVDAYIDQLTGGDPDYKLLLGEVMGYPLITNPERIRSIAKFFIFRGNGANGKSTMLQIMKRIYKERNCSALSIKQCADTRYQVSMLGKLVNLGDDCEPETINNDQMKILKNICSADTIEARRLYQQSFYATFTVKLIFTSNSDIKSFEKGYAFKRRILWMPMFNVVDSPDPGFISKMTTPDALKYWTRLMVEGYQRLYHNKSLTFCQKVKTYNDQYHLENNHMAMWLSNIDIDTVILGKTPKEVKQSYEEQNDDNDKKYSPKLLKERLQEMGIGLGAKRIGPKTNDRKNVYMRQSDTKQSLFGVSKGVEV